MFNIGSKARKLFVEADSNFVKLRTIWLENSRLLYNPSDPYILGLTVFGGEEKLRQFTKHYLEQYHELVAIHKRLAEGLTIPSRQLINALILWRTYLQYQLYIEDSVKHGYEPGFSREWHEQVKTTKSELDVALRQISK